MGKKRAWDKSGVDYGGNKNTIYSSKLDFLWSSSEVYEVAFDIKTNSSLVHYM